MALPLIALVVGILAQLVLGRWLSPRLKGWLAFASGLAAFGATLALASTTASGGTFDVVLWTWDVGVPVGLHIDGLSLVFLLMATGIGSAILLYCVSYMAHEPEGTTRFYALMLTFITGMALLVSADNLLIMYLSWEVIGLCSYLLVGFWYKRTEAVNGARKVLVMTHLAGYGFLAAILLLFVATGTFVWTDPAIGAALSTGLFVLLLGAALAKSVAFPLHTWIPEAMNAPTPVSALLHSACYVKAGVYLVARLYAIVAWQPAWNTLVLALGCATMVVGALFALTQTDLKRMLAFSTISQLGYILTGLGLGTPLGVAAALFYTLSHGLFKGTLFMCAGAVQHATGTRDLRQLGGLARFLPHTALIWLVAAAAIIGLPLTNGFVAKWLLFDAALEAGQSAVVFVAWIVSTLTAFYLLKATATIFFGSAPVVFAQHPPHEGESSLRGAMALLAAACLVFGVAPQLVLQPVIGPAVKALGFDWAVTVSWLGVRTSSANLALTSGALLSVIAVAAGWAVVRLARPTTRLGVNRFVGGDPIAEAGGELTAEDFSAMANTTLQPVFQVVDPDPLYLGVWRGLRTAAARFDEVWTPLSEHHPYAFTAGLIALVVAALWMR